jgi:DNA-binding MarR family transcriptional regulator
VTRFIAPLTSPARLAALIDRLGRLARGRRFAHGLNPAQWEALGYLGIANRHSRNPGALAEYLGATKGTVSQTLIALQRKGLVEQSPDPADRRVRRLDLTLAGRRLLARDPLAELVAAAAVLGAGRCDDVAGGLTDLLRGLQGRHGYRSFGLCASCRFFRRDGAPGVGPHLCVLTGEALDDPAAALICRRHEAKAA